MKLSDNFTLAEVTFTRHDVDNDPNEAQTDRLRIFAQTIGQKIRNRWGIVIVTCGFRSEALNVAVYYPRQPLTTSYHLTGDAWDMVFADDDVTPEMVQRWLWANRAWIPFDKAIVERVRGRAWLHVQQAKPGRTPRQTCWKTSDGATYQQVHFE